VEVRIGLAAKRELRIASRYYDRQRPGLGEEFLDEVQRVSSLLAMHPELGRELLGQRRVLTLRRFPYRLVYVLAGSYIRIVAVAHLRQRPLYWQHRVEESRPRYLVLPAAA
jgi:toxin ParE1/3/4